MPRDDEAAVQRGTAPVDADVPPYVRDILAQPSALRRLARNPLRAELAAVSEQVGRHSRIVLTGMGASLAALHPAWLRLARAGLPVWRLETAALEQDASGLLTRDTLVVSASQSGHSAEIVALAERLPAIGASLVTLTNDPLSPLAARSDVVLDIAAGEEHAVSTRSYLNTLAVAALVADAVVGGDSQPALRSAADAIERFLLGWRERVDSLTALLGLPERLYLLARGDSSAAAEYGALILKEAAKWPVEAMTAGQFRHGPLELADRRLTAIVLTGEDAQEQRRNARLIADLARYGARAHLLAAGGRPGEATIEAPVGSGAGLALAQALPIQLLSVAIARQTGIEPGAFRHLEKVTTVE
jgi:glutamine---fructose-6-phosphate transaminase (isomerizing)